MITKAKNIVLICVMAVLLFGLSFCFWFGEKDDFSESERRLLASFPKFNGETVLSGDFMDDFEDYSLDQFPWRDQFRRLKAVTALDVFQKMDNNGVYVADGYVSKLEYPLNTEMLDHAAERFEYIYNQYLAGTDTNLYFSIVPDKNYYLAEPSGRLSVDYNALISYMCDKTEYMEYIDITDLLSIDDYYKTDTHWRQEKLLPVAQRLADQMGVAISDKYTENTLSEPFYGVYTGQSALPLFPDTIRYLTSDTLSACEVTSYDTGAAVGGEIYDLKAAAGVDPYEMFLCGADALVVVENPNAATDRELVVFRDSFASSLMPLMIEGYAKVVLIDIRYIQSSFIGNFVDFDKQDVLFIYSTMMLNNSLAFK